MVGTFAGLLDLQQSGGREVFRAGVFRVLGELCYICPHTPVYNKEKTHNCR